MGVLNYIYQLIKYIYGIVIYYNMLYIYNLVIWLFIMFFIYNLIYIGRYKLCLSFSQVLVNFFELEIDFLLWSYLFGFSFEY